MIVDLPTLGFEEAKVLSRRQGLPIRSRCLLACPRGAAGLASEFGGVFGRGTIEHFRPFDPGSVRPAGDPARYDDWELDDPARQDVEAVRPIRNEIRTRVHALLASLGVSSA